MTQPHASVVIPVKNGGAALHVQLSAMAAQQVSVPWELVVVDNGSTDGTQAAVADWIAAHPHVDARLVDGSARRGVAGARNLGASEAMGELLLYCDADDEADPLWAQTLIDALATAPMVSGKLALERLNTPALLRQRANVLPANPGRAYGRGFAISANVAIRRSVFDEVGGCNEALQSCGEDVDLSWRVQALGHAIAYVPEAVMHYRLRPDTRSFMRQQYLYGRVAPDLFALHPPTAADVAIESPLGWLAANARRIVRHPRGAAAFELRQRVAYRRGVLAGRRQARTRPRVGQG